MRDFKYMGRKIGRACLFFGILFLILAGVTRVMESALIQNDNLAHSRNKSFFRIQREPEGTIDVLVVGDSLSYSAISPMELWSRNGIPCYVCGQTGQKIQETYDMLETALTNQAPQVVILETNTMFRDGGRKAALTEWIAQLGNHYIPIFRYHDVWKTFFINKRYPEENYKGFSFRSAVHPYKKGVYMKETKQMEKIPRIVLIYMDKIAELCEKKNTKLILVSTPSPKNYNYARHNSLKAYAKQKGLDYQDLNLKTDKIGIDWSTDSLDRGDHLNLSGAWKVSKYLGDYLADQYRLPDRRNQKEYLAWNVLEKEYRVKMDSYRKRIAEKKG